MKKSLLRLSLLLAGALLILPLTALAAGSETADAPVLAADGGSFTYQGQRMPLLISDIDPAAWYYDAAVWAVKTGRMSVNDLGAFEPDRPCATEPCSRADVLTLLWRAYGEVEPTLTQHPFTDVPADADYVKALLWAVETGVTTGTSPTTFAPDRPCTRGELAVFLSRASER